jgi:DNA gyrase subunit A
MRVVIELKRDTTPEKVLQTLYKKTALKSNFGVILLSLVDGQPRELSLKQILAEFLKFREATVTRQYGNELEQKEARRHAVEGLLTALGNLDLVVDILRNAPDGTTAKQRFQEALALSDSQSDSILAMPMRRLTGLERQKLEQEFAELEQEIARLNKLLSDRHELLKSLKRDLRSLKRKFADPRRTRLPELTAIAPAQPETATDAAEPDETATIEATDEETPKKKRRKKVSEPTTSLLTLLPQQSETSHVAIASTGEIYWGNEDAGMTNEDTLLYQEQIGSQTNLIVCTDQGKAYPVAIADLPYHEQRDKPSLSDLLPDHAQRDQHQPITQFMLPANLEGLDLLLLTSQGKIKRLAASELSDFTSRGLSLIKLKDDDRLQFAFFVEPNDHVAIAVSSGRVLHLPISQAEIPVQGRTSQGNQALKLRFNEKIVGCVPFQREGELYLMSEEGYGKRIDVQGLRLGRRGDMGNHVMRFESKTDLLLRLFSPLKNTAFWAVDTAGNEQILPLDKFPLESKDSSGRQLIKLPKGDRLVRCHLAHQQSP